MTPPAILKLRWVQGALVVAILTCIALATIHARSRYLSIEALRGCYVAGDQWLEVQEGVLIVDKRRIPMRLDDNNAGTTIWPERSIHARGGAVRVGGRPVWAIDARQDGGVHLELHDPHGTPLRLEKASCPRTHKLS